MKSQNSFSMTLYYNEIMFEHVNWIELAQGYASTGISLQGIY
jgi:hypothetical protein